MSPRIRSRRVALALGFLGLLVGFACLYDAYDGRGRRKPRVLGPFLPW